MNNVNSEIILWFFFADDDSNGVDHAAILRYFMVSKLYYLKPL